MPQGIIQAETSILCVVDIQERLLPHMSESERVVAGTDRLIRAAQMLKVPVAVTEQYPKGLGPTVEAVKAHISPDIPVLEKTLFSCYGAPEFEELIEKSGRFTLVLCGIETHVCVLQTALDAAEKGLRVVVVADAVSSRSPENHQQALGRLRQAGVTIATTEMVLMEWVGDAKHPAFKDVQKLIK
ncbi:MAG: isochorismatase family protein [Candidatus Sumerlaeota bacterium]